MTYSARIRNVVFICFLAFIHLCRPGEIAADDRLSSQSEACLFCHRTATPGIVADWERSRHAAVTPAEAIAKPSLERRVSMTQTTAVEAEQKIVSCMECHGLNTDSHKDSFDHYGFRVNVVVTPADCATCHPTEYEQYRGSKKANAVGNLSNNAVYSTLVETIISVKSFDDAGYHVKPSTESTRGETCFACHGTEISVNGTRTVSGSLGALSVPRLSNWPNQGVGRINPDGSMGACTSCHPRHGFSLEVARSPATCGQCHLEPDVPAYNVYRESKHGNIYSAIGSKWNFDSVPWIIGEDFNAPTCATCHISLLVDSNGDIVAERSHDFGSRLWTRIFGLIVSHPQPKDGRTYLIQNDEGAPLPTTFSGTPASKGLINADEQHIRKERMLNVCGACHSISWTSGHFERFDRTVAEADEMVLAATSLVEKAWDTGIADASNPFDELIEAHWVRQWLFYANSLRYASAMSGPDYAAFKNGWWYLSENLLEMREIVE